MFLLLLCFVSIAQHRSFTKDTMKRDEKKNIIQTKAIKYNMFVVSLQLSEAIIGMRKKFPESTYVDGWMDK